MRKEAISGDREKNPKAKNKKSLGGGGCAELTLEFVGYMFQVFKNHKSITHFWKEITKFTEEHHPRQLSTQDSQRVGS